MSRTDGIQASAGLGAPLQVDADAFRRLGHQLIEDLADRLAAVPHGPVTVAERPSDVRDALGARNGLPEMGTDPADLLRRATSLLFEHSLFNGHPKFLGYITSSPAPIGMLGDLLAAAVNANVGGWNLAPMATEIELQTVRWIAELIGYPVDCGGLMVSGGNMANMLGYFAARAAKTPWDVRTHGVAAKAVRLRVYASSETHTWVQKATDLSGLGTDAVRWIPTDAAQRMDVDALVRQIDEDRAQGDVPVMVVGTAGTVSTGAIDPLRAIARVCRERDIWFHVDGAYGGFAAALPDAPDDLKALAEADSVAVDPHKWLYAPLEVGCCLVRRPEALPAAFSFHPPYYHFDESVVNFFDYGPQNSRGFRALKVWLALQHAGARGYRTMMAHDVAMARLLGERPGGACGVRSARDRAQHHHVPLRPARPARPDGRAEACRSTWTISNRALLDASQKRGEVFVSNAVTDGRFLLRACLVNFNTRDSDIRAVPDLLAPLGRRLDAERRPAGVRQRAVKEDGRRATGDRKLGHTTGGHHECTSGSIGTANRRGRPEPGVVCGRTDGVGVEHRGQARRTARGRHHPPRRQRVSDRGAPRLGDRRGQDRDRRHLGRRGRHERQARAGQRGRRQGRDTRTASPREH